MGKFDKEIAKAQKIADGWLKTSEDYGKDLISLKKNNLKWEKDYIKTITQSHQIDAARDNLKQFAERGQKIYDDHFKWARGEPRNGIRFIDGKLKLGGQKTEAYQAVAKALDKVLIGLGKTVSTTEGIWDRDLSFAIKTQETKLKAIEKTLSGELGKTQALMKQLKKEAKSYAAMCDKALTNIKFESDSQIYTKLASDGYDAMLPVGRKALRQIFDKKIDLMAKIDPLIVKNHGRVEKSVPSSFMTSWLASTSKKEIDEKKKYTLGKLKEMSNYYQRLGVAWDKKYGND